MLIDVHQHVGSVAGYLGVASTERGSDEDWALRSEASAQLAISHAILQPAFEYATSQGTDSIRMVNDGLANYVASHDFALSALGVVDPLGMQDPAAEAERIVSELQFAGISWHSRFQRLPTNARQVMEVIDACPAMTRVIAVHCVAESKMEAPWRLEVLLEAFPQRRFLAMSSLTAPSQCDEMIELCRRRPNLYLETAGITPLGLWIERAVSKLGSHRLLFGTDLYVSPPLFRHNYAWQAIEAARISDDDRNRIYSANAMELFDVRPSVESQTPVDKRQKR